MEYVPLHYYGESSKVVDVAATPDPRTAVAPTLRRSRASEQEGVIGVINDQPIIHCRPRCD